MLKEIDDRNIRHRFPLYLDEYVRTYCKDMGRCSVFLDVIFIGAVIRTYYVKIRKIDPQIVYFLCRLDIRFLIMANEEYPAVAASKPEHADNNPVQSADGENAGAFILDATCSSFNIKYPQDSTDKRQRR